MKQTIFLILSLICFVFSCNAQIKEIQDSPFLNVQISGILRPVFPPSKEDLKRQKKELKKLEKNPPHCHDCFEPIDFDLKVEQVRLPDGKIAAFLTAQIENKESTFEKVGKVPTSRIQIFGQVTRADNEMRGFFQEEIVFSKNETEINAPISRDKQNYTKGLLLPPGLYKVIFILKDLTTNKIGLRSFPLQIPNS